MIVGSFDHFSPRSVLVIDAEKLVTFSIYATYYEADDEGEDTGDEDEEQVQKPQVGARRPSYILRSLTEE